MDNEIQIDGLPLPAYMIELISLDRWITPDNTTVLRQFAGFTGNTNIHLLKVENMVRVNQLTHLLEDPETAQIYGFASSIQNGNEILDEEMLDVDKAIMIAMNWDDEAICLDYRHSLKNPCVVSGIVEHNRIIWKKIANDFKSFADHIGL